MRWTRFTAVLVIVSMLSGCISYTPIGLQTTAGGDVQLSQPIKPGDRVRLVKKSGETSVFRAVVVERNRISSENATYELEDIQSIEVVRADNERTTLILLVAVAFVALAAVFLNEVEDTVDCIAGNC